MIIAFGWIGATSAFGSHVTIANPRAVLGVLPEPGHREHGLIRDLKPHLPVQLRLSVAQVVLVGRPFAELGQRDQAALIGLGKRLADIAWRGGLLGLGYSFSPRIG